MRVCSICKSPAQNEKCPICGSSPIIDLYLEDDRIIELCKNNSKNSGAIYQNAKKRGLLRSPNTIELALKRMSLSIEDDTRNATYRTIVNPINPIDVAVLIENNHFYSGGRYFGYQVIKALAEIVPNLVVFTNMEPIFSSDFIDYKFHKTVYVKDIRKVDVKARIYISFPVYGNITAVNLAKQYDGRCLAFVFDPLPLIAKHMPSDYKMEEKYFAPMIPSLKEKDVEIVGISEYVRKSSKNWLNKKKVWKVEPVVNDRVLAPILKNEIKKENWICTVSRVVNRKNYTDVLKAFAPISDKYRLKFITSMPDKIEKEIEAMNLKDRIDFILAPSDTEKFEIMSKCKAMICASKFEGFGMWLIEALACGIPCVCYDYPTFREISKDLVYLSRNLNELTKNLAKAVKEQPREFDTRYYQPRLIKQLERVLNGKQED